MRKFQQAFEQLRRKGEVELFAVLMPTDAEGMWDVVVAAPWLQNELAGYAEVDRALKSSLSPVDRRRLSRMVILEPESEAVQELLEQLPPGWSGRMSHFSFGGVRIRRGQIIHAAGKAAGERV